TVTLRGVGAPETRYAKSGDVHIAYQVIGDGPFDLVLVPGFVSNVEHYWEMPVVPVMFQRLASFSRLILWDKRGTGLSDPVAGVPSLDERMDDLRAVMDAAGASPGMARAVLQALSEIDVRSILDTVRVPTLILHRTDERVATVHGARLMAQTIPDARLVELPGQDHLPFVGDWEVLIDEIEE